ncbi:hypothetical protein J6590_016904 [Homalodisca vitripennis]|nr:hypothetical protein J6590_016904 [Homalodisca vitripennis]
MTISHFNCCGRFVIVTYEGTSTRSDDDDVDEVRAQHANRKLMTEIVVRFDSLPPGALLSSPLPSIRCLIPRLGTRHRLPQFLEIYPEKLIGSKDISVVKMSRLSQVPESVSAKSGLKMESQ